MKKGLIFFTGIILTLTLMQFVFAGVGIKWEQESFLVNEGEKTCLTYSVYNPWPEDSYVQIELSENLKDLLTSQEFEAKLVPANTSSANAIPINFCFKVSEVYEENCLIGGVLCEKECKEEQKIYNGDVSIKSASGGTEISGSGGSATQMSVSAPLNLKVVCNAHPTDFSLIYIVLAVISLVAIVIILYKKYRKPEQERKREKLDKLMKEMRKLKEKK